MRSGGSATEAKCCPITSFAAEVQQLRALRLVNLDSFCNSASNALLCGTFWGEVRGDQGRPLALLKNRSGAIRAGFSLSGRLARAQAKIGPWIK